MSQSTLGDDDLFGEAAAEIYADVEEHLGEARSALPDPDDARKADADNIFGVLNGPRSSLDVEGMVEHARQTKRWYVIGQYVEALDDLEDLEAAIEELEALIETVKEAREPAGELTSTTSQSRDALTDVAEAVEVASAGEDEDEDEEEE